MRTPHLTFICQLLTSQLQAVREVALEVDVGVRSRGRVRSPGPKSRSGPVPFPKGAASAWYSSYPGLSLALSLAGPPFWAS